MITIDLLSVRVRALLLDTLKKHSVDSGELFWGVFRAVSDPNINTRVPLSAYSPELGKVPLQTSFGWRETVERKPFNIVAIFQ